MWNCDEEVSCDGYYISNTRSQRSGNATFSKNFAGVPHIVFTVQVVELGTGFKISLLTDHGPSQLLDVSPEGKVAGTSICGADSRVTVHIKGKDLLMYVNDMKLEDKTLEYDASLHLQLELRPAAGLLFDMSNSLSSIATSVNVLRKQGLTCSAPDPNTYALDAISNVINKEMQDSGSVIFDRSVSAKYHFYQLRILACGDDSAIGIGLADRTHNPSHFPGWKSKSCGYHSDDGILFKKGQHNKIMPACGMGDVMGCGVRYPTRDPSSVPRGYGEPAKGEKVTVYFTKNSVEVGEVSMVVPEGGLYPTVGLREGDRVAVNFAAVSG